MSKIDFHELQLTQYKHDSNYHQDIICLRTSERVKHLILHFTKYLGRFHEQGFNVKTITDTLICCLSLANTLGIKINSSEMTFQSSVTFDSFLKSYAISIGAMAKAIEATDHLEAFDTKETLNKELYILLEVVTGFSLKQKMDPVSSICTRLREVETSHFLNENASTISSQKKMKPRY